MRHSVKSFIRLQRFFAFLTAVMTYGSAFAIPTEPSVVSGNAFFGTTITEPGIYSGSGPFRFPDGTIVQSSDSAVTVDYGGATGIRSITSPGNISVTSSDSSQGPPIWSSSVTLTSGGSINNASPILVSGSGSVGGTLTLTGGTLTLTGLSGSSALTADAAHFVQPTASSAELNRVIGGNIAIQGELSSEGKIWLVAPDGTALFARTGSGAIEPAHIANTLRVTSVGSSSALSAIGTVPNGAHSRPLQYRAEPGRGTMWVAGDLGQDNHANRDGNFVLGEVGMGYNFGFVQINASLGQTKTHQNTLLGGRANTDGNYVLAEALLPLAQSDIDRARLWLTLGSYFHWGDAKIRRGYLNFGVPDSSSGSPNTHAWGLRIRFDLENAVSAGSFALSPYADLSSGVLRMNGYTETGGGFPARFDARRETQSEVRLGTHAAYRLTADTRLVGLLEAAHRLQKHTSRTSGEVVGMFSFNLLGENTRQDWLRSGLGLEQHIGGGTLSAMLNLTTKGSAPNAWLALSYQIGF